MLGGRTINRFSKVGEPQPFEFFLLSPVQGAKHTPL